MEVRIEAVPEKTRPAFGLKETLAAGWILLAMVLAFLVTIHLEGSFPVFTFVMLAAALFILIKQSQAAQIGMTGIRLADLAKYTLVSLAGSLGLMLIFEPWSHTYQTLLSAAVSSEHVDTTFGWLVRYEGLAGWAGFATYAGLVTLFAEELFFRGWLLNALKRKMSARKAIFWQAVLFTLPQLLAAFMLPPTQGMLYTVIYSWLAIGLIGGWAAHRTGAIWPSLLSATVYNLVMGYLTF